MKNRSKKITISTILFRSYAGLIVLLIMICFVGSLIYFVKDRINGIEDLQNSLCSSARNSVESSIEKMSIVSMNVLYSSNIREELRKVDYSTANVGTMGKIYSALSSIIGPYGTVTQVDIHSINNFKVGWGVYELYALENYYEIEDYNAIKEKGGFKYFSVPRYREDLVYYNRFLKQKKFISLYRMFTRGYYEEEGILEVIQDCDTFFKDLNSISEKNENIDIFIYNKNEELIYPYRDDLEFDDSFIKAILNELSHFNEREVSRFIDDDMFITSTWVEDSSWKIIIKQDKKEAFYKLYIFISIYLLIGLLFIGLAAWICYKIALKVTTPIYKLKERMESVDLNDIVNSNIKKSEIITNTIEIEMLSEVFNNMCIKLETSTKELMSAKVEELRAKMIATQSMINPHFIFNNLTNISIMAEENMNSEIIALSRNLCDYLRYISVDSLTTVDLKTEVLYTQKYLECMKVRYGKRLACCFDIPEELESVMISKLTLQPIVENALKYAFQNEPPWKLEITGNKCSNGWALIIRDNGIGIMEGAREEIFRNQKEIRQKKDISNMRIGGMGLANVYLRLLLLHGDNSQLIIQNRPDGGTEVIIRVEK